MADARQSIRPRIATEGTAVSEAERFQNAVLRPILKMQNELLIAVFRHFLEKRKIPFQRFSQQQRHEHIAHALRKDNRLRGLALGTVIGHFTPDEYAAFLTDEAELSRRITDMMVQRLQDQAERLLPE